MISMDYPPVPGGISAHVHELSKALVQAGNRVTVVTRRRSRAEPERSSGDGIEIYRVTLKYTALVYGLQIRSSVRRILPEVNPDLIHIHGMGPLEWYNITSIPLAYTNHTSGYLRRLQKGGIRRMAMLKRNFRKVDLFLAPSRELLQVPFDIPAPKRFIANGVDGSKFLFTADQRRRVRGRLGIKDDQLAAIVTRRLVDKNGVIYLARATQFLHSDKIVFVVIGDGPERNAVEKEFSRHLGARALFLGNKTHGEIVEYYSAADFSVLPSLMEATSISGLEAMAAGLALVGTGVGGIPELIRDGYNGYLCRPADPSDLAEKINTLLKDDYRLFGTHSRKLIEDHFDWQNVARKTLEAYREVASDSE